MLGIGLVGLFGCLGVRTISIVLSQTVRQPGHVADGVEEECKSIMLGDQNGVTTISNDLEHRTGITAADRYTPHLRVTVAIDEAPPQQDTPLRQNL